MAPRRNGQKGKIRYAVVGLGYIAQGAILPAFAHAKNSELAALVSSDEVKLKKLGKKYGVKNLYLYDQYVDCLRSGHIDAVYIALPNDMHRDYAVRAAAAGIHVLCEKPLGVTEEDCVAMINAARENKVKLMVAYRLHFEEANLKAIETVQSGVIGEPRVFSSLFTLQVADENNIRLKGERGGGTLYDIGIYCINAARYLFRSEPEEVVAFSATAGDDRRFREVEEMVSAIMRFPGNRLALFTSSFGASDTSQYRVLGTKGDLRVEPAYEVAEDLKHYLTVNGKTREKTFKKRDQFAPELIAFSNCILKNREPEPSGAEGLIDVRIIRALYRSIEIGSPVRLGVPERERRPTPGQEIRRPPVEEPQYIHAKPPH